MKQVETLPHQDEKVDLLTVKRQHQRDSVWCIDHGSMAPGMTWSFSSCFCEHQHCEQGHCINLGYLGRILTSQGLIYINHFCPLFPLPIAWFYCL